MPARVMVFAKVPAWEAEAFEEAYLAVSARMKQVPGILTDELLRDTEGSGYVLLTEWESAKHFADWVSSPVHPTMTTETRPWSSSFEYRVYRIAQVAPGPPGRAAGSVPSCGRGDERGDLAVSAG